MQGGHSEPILAQGPRFVIPMRMIVLLQPLIEFDIPVKLSPCASSLSSYLKTSNTRADTRTYWTGRHRLYKAYQL